MKTLRNWSIDESYYEAVFVDSSPNCIFRRVTVTDVDAAGEIFIDHGDCGGCILPARELYEWLGKQLEKAE